jgi:hypothetical protein
MAAPAITADIQKVVQLRQGMPTRFPQLLMAAWRMIRQFGLKPGKSGLPLEALR